MGAISFPHPILKIYIVPNVEQNKLKEGKEKKKMHVFNYVESVLSLLFGVLF